MGVSQGQPQLFFKPSQILGEAVGAAGQTTILLSLGQGIPFHKTGVNPLTHRRLGQSRRDGHSIPKDDVGINCRDPSPCSLLDHLGIQQVGPRSASRLGRGTARPAPRGTVPFPMDLQQRLGVSRPLIAGEQGRVRYHRSPTRPARASGPRGFDRVCRSQSPTPGARPGQTPTTPRRLHPSRRSPWRRASFPVWYG